MRDRAGRHWIELVSSLCVVTACGGNVDTGSPRGASGSYAYGTGGSAATGGAFGSGGTSPSGGTMGTGGVSSAYLMGLVSQICNAATALNCSNSSNLRDCTSSGDDLVVAAMNAGCSPAAQSAFECLAAPGALYCDASGSPAVSSDCDNRFVVLQNCTTNSPSPTPTQPCTGTGSGSSNGASSCSITCGTLSASCTGTIANQPVSCSCSNGPAAGMRFSLASCAALTALPDVCR